jgi:hypothetical protein
MDSLGPLLMYMVFSLPNSVTECILRSPFAPVERGAEAGFERSEIGQFELKTGRNRVVIGGWADKPGGAWGWVGDQRKPRRRDEKRSDSAENRTGHATVGRPVRNRQRRVFLVSLLLCRLRCVSTEFFWFSLIFTEFFKNRRDGDVGFLWLYQIFEHCCLVQFATGVSQFDWGTGHCPVGRYWRRDLASCYFRYTVLYWFVKNQILKQPWAKTDGSSC